MVSSANSEMHEGFRWQDDTYEEVVLLAMPDPGDPVAEDSFQHNGDADTSLQSVEAPAIEPGVREGTPPRFTGSGTAWTGAKAARQS